MNDFISYILYLLQRGICFVVPALLLCVLVLAGGWGIARKKERRFPWRRAIALLLLVIWFGLTLFVTLFRGESGARQWNFHLFLAWKEAWNQFALRAWLNVLLNIALFVPLGSLLPLLFRVFRNWYAVLLAGFGASLAIELAQLATARGMFDIDDLFTNALGTMIGWSIVMLVLSALERKNGWKVQNIAYLSVPMALILVLAGIFIGYAVKPYGNLQDAPAVTANLKNVRWKLGFTPQEEPVTAWVYEVGRLDQAACEQFGTQFAQSVGFSIEDIYYYDDTIWFGNHSSGDFLFVNRLDGTWEYNLGRETAPVFDVHPEEVRSGDILDALHQLGIEVPEDIQFTIQSPDENEFFTASAEVKLVPGAEKQWYGTLQCDLHYQDGKTELDQIDYRIVTLLPCREESILSPAQAVQELYDGHSFQGRILEYSQVSQVTVLSCALEWKGDTKGFYQPVYRLELQLQDRGTMTDYVSALK